MGVSLEGHFLRLIPQLRELENSSRSQDTKFDAFSDQLRHVAENHVTLDDFQSFCDNIGVAMKNQHKEIQDRMQAKLAAVQRSAPAAPTAATSAKLAYMVHEEELTNMKAELTNMKPKLTEIEHRVKSQGAKHLDVEGKINEL